MTNLRIQDFIPRLQDHLYARLSGYIFEGEEIERSRDERNSIHFVANCIYSHKTLRVNYTTYDGQRSQDVINPSAHADIMVLSHEDDDTIDAHPYWYARVVSLFHVNVYRAPLGDLAGVPPQRMDVLWVRWFGRDLDEPGGFATKRLPKVGFVPYTPNNGEAFGFLDPRVVIRGSHVIPLFADGCTTARLPPSFTQVGQNKQEEDESEHNTDYAYYYVNMFVDRDMFMRYLGGGIGHMGVGTSTSTAFDNEDFEWQDVGKEEDRVEGTDSSNSDTEGPFAHAITSESDIQQLVRDLGNITNVVTHGAFPEDDSEERQSGDEEDEEGESSAPEIVMEAPEGPGTSRRVAANLSDTEDEDEEEDKYAFGGFAPL